MILLGRIQTLRVVKKTDFGVYLSDQGIDADVSIIPDKKEVIDVPSILLPKAQAKELTTGDTVEVFIYKDSEDRPIATTAKPFLTLGSIARLTVKEVTNIGAFLDWGLAKDLFLPFKEQTFRVQKGDSVLVTLYVL